MANTAYRPNVAVFSGGGTGGHLYPALALADALSKIRPDLRTFFVGARQGVEARILPERGEDHLLLPVRGFRRGRVLENLAVGWALLISLVLTGQLFSRLRPGVVVVTGGYASGPAGLAAGLMGIPLALQEQNAHPGFTTRVLSRWSRQAHLAFPEARDLLPARARSRARLSGNPVREVVPMDPTEAKARFGIEPGSRVILVVGGSQGAEALNKAVLEVIRGVVAGELERPEDIHLIWATGPKKLEKIRSELSVIGQPEWVHALGYIQEMPEALSAATLAVSRAGAMTTSEFLAWGVPALLIPLPTAAADHQSRNAESLARAGTAIHLPEKELTGATLWQAAVSLLSNPGALLAMREAALKAGRPGATREIAEALELLLPRPAPGFWRGIEEVAS
ncbi:MAG: undecaprenyldiphospho-muramoylpentapeptide beta-N-acetylglucosaminyltransferase [Longimicrobiales bacterium]|nr:undecaprenyldiphospho-muramoylpentapeptide beta-N-acetylglucosaminyltransferase [Longimicrobiales bacterium]